MTTAPDFMPVLSAGKHQSPKDGACVMEYVSVIAGEPFTDTPACTEYLLARAAWNVNDNLPDDKRHLLIPFITRLIGTSGYEYDERAMTDALAAIEPTRTFPFYTRDADAPSCMTLAEVAQYIRSERGWVESEVTGEVTYLLVTRLSDGPEDKVAMLGKILDIFDSVTGHSDAGDLTQQINAAAALIGAAK